MVGVSVLLMAAVILFGLSKVRRGVMSTSNGKWPPECFMTSLLFTH